MLHFLSFMIVNEECLGFELLVGQENFLLKYYFQLLEIVKCNFSHFPDIL